MPVFSLSGPKSSISILKSSGRVSGVAVPQKRQEEDDNLSVFNYLENSVCEKIRSTQMDVMTPLESLTLLYELKKMLS